MRYRGRSLLLPLRRRRRHGTLGVCAHCQDILDSKANRPTRPILTIPTELQLQIFKLLGSVSSTCLGLTCQKFYPIHRELNKTVSLGEWYEEPRTDFIIDLGVPYKKGGSNLHYDCDYELFLVPAPGRSSQRTRQCMENESSHESPHKRSPPKN